MMRPGAGARVGVEGGRWKVGYEVIVKSVLVDYRTIGVAILARCEACSDRAAHTLSITLA